MNSRFLNVGIRGVTVGGRFALILFLAKILSPEELGVFGLITSLLLLSVSIASFDFKKYAFRELLSTDKSRWPEIFNNQIKFQTIAYLLITPFFLLFFFYEIIDWKYGVWFFILHVLVYISLELEQLLIALDEQLNSSMVFFMQTSFWIFISSPIMYFHEEYRNLEFIFLSWIMGAFFSISFAVYFLKGVNIKVKFDNVNWKWIREGVRTSLKYFTALVFLKVLLSVDKVSVEVIGTAVDLGVYVFFFSIVFGIFNFIEPAVFAFIYPRMVQNKANRNSKEYKKNIREMALSTAVLILLISFTIYYLMPYLIKALQKEIFMENLDHLALFIIAAVFYIASYVPHYILYSSRKDSCIVISHLASLLVFVASLWLLEEKSTVVLVITSMMFAMCALFFSKLFFSLDRKVLHA